MTGKIRHIKEPKRQGGAYIPIFERLVDQDPEEDYEYPVVKFYEKEDLIDSIKRELMHILGTQAKVKKEDYDELSTDPLNYALPEMFGVPEFTYLDATNRENWKPLSKKIGKIIEVYEPRLKNITVTIQDFQATTQFLDLSVTAGLAIPEFQEEATFFLNLNMG